MMETVHGHIRNMRRMGATMHPNIFYPQYPGTTLRVLGLPLPPSANHLYPTGRGGRRHKSTEYAQWLADANLYAMVQSYPVLFDSPPKGTPWYFTLGVYLPAYTRDISNVVKPVEDWLAGRLGLDDRYVRGFTVRRWPVKEDAVGLEALVYIA